MVIYVDIDGTICKTEGSDYENAVPMMDKIAEVNRYYMEGHEIIYWTARGAKSGADWRDLTLKQLDEWGAKHDGLRLDKPFYDLLIDDRTRTKVI